MKRYMIILLLIAGFSYSSEAQVFRKKEKQEVNEKRKVKPRKQMDHFEDQKKDKKMASNGSSYKKKSKYKVDGDGFAAYQPIRRDRSLPFIPSKEKRYQKKYKRMMYAVR